jgi:predicted MFS family arabinose efflux permease
VILILFTMSRPEQPGLSNREPLLTQLRQAWDFVRSHPTVYPLIIGVAFFGVFGFTPTILIPVFADRVLNVGVRGLGLLMGAAGVGALSGSLIQASLPRESARGRIVYYGAVGLALALLGFALSKWFPLSLILMGIFGFAMILMLTSLVTLMLNLSPEELHGRVMGLYTTAFVGLAPIGTLLAGALASGIGAPATMALYSVLCLASTFVIFRNLGKPLPSPLPS